MTGPTTRINGKVTIPTWLLVVLLTGGVGGGGVAAWQAKPGGNDDRIRVLADESVQRHANTGPHPGAVSEAQYYRDIEGIRADLREIRRLLTEGD